MRRSAVGDAGARRPTVLLGIRRGRQAKWDADAVAEHLMGCRLQIMRGLARKTPWAGLDEETLDSCYGHGAAVVARIAADGQRQEWRTPKDLERAQVAAFRHQALDHWRRVNALSRQGDRDAVAFDPERHGSDEAPLDRLFEQPDLHTIERDLLAELVDADLHAFWRSVLREHLSFKDAGDRLGLNKAGVMAATRSGRAAFASYLDRRSTGELCTERSLDVLALRAGSASKQQRERADAHLECCYACALVHDPATSALQRGILGLAPTGLVLRLVSRAGDLAASPAGRIADTGSGSRAVAAGLAAVAVAGSGVGIEAATDSPAEPSQRTRTDAARRAVPFTPSVVPTSRPAKVTPSVSPPPIVEPAASTPVAKRSAPKATPRRVQKVASKPPVRLSPSARTSSPAPTPEFDFEQSSPSSPSPRVTPAPAAVAPKASSDPAVSEFATP